MTTTKPTSAIDERQLSPEEALEESSFGDYDNDPTQRVVLLSDAISALRAERERAMEMREALAKAATEMDEHNRKYHHHTDSVFIDYCRALAQKGGGE